jgi:hypothetical protein
MSCRLAVSWVKAEFVKVSRQSADTASSEVWLRNQVPEPLGSDVAVFNNLEATLAQIDSYPVQIDVAVPVEPKSAWTGRLCEVDDKQTTAQPQNTNGLPTEILASFFRQMVEHQGAENDVKFSVLERQLLSSRGREADPDTCSTRLRRRARDHLSGRINPLHTPIGPYLFLG